MHIVESVSNTSHLPRIKKFGRTPSSTTINLHKKDLVVFPFSFDFTVIKQLSKGESFYFFLVNKSSAMSCSFSSITSPHSNIHHHPFCGLANWQTSRCFVDEFNSMISFFQTKSIWFDDLKARDIQVSLPHFKQS